MRRCPPPINFGGACAQGPTNRKLDPLPAATRRPRLIPNVMILPHSHAPAAARPLPDQGQNSRKTLSRLVHEQAVREWRTYAISAVLIAILAICVTSTAYLVGSVVKAATLTRSFQTVLFLSAAIIGIFLLKGFVQYAQAMLLARLQTTLTAFYQRQLFDRLLLEGMQHLTSAHSSQTINRLLLSSEAPAKVVDVLIRIMGRDVLLVVGLGAVMIYQDPLLSFGCLLSAPVIFAITRLLRTQLDSTAQSARYAQEHISEILQETLLGMRLVKAFGLEQSIRQRTHKRIEDLREANETIAQLTWRFIPWVETLSGCAVALILLYGSHRVITLQSTEGELVSFLTAFLLAYEPIKRVARFPAEIGHALANTRVLYEILDSEASEPSEIDKPALIVKEGRIVLDDVQFSYRDRDNVLCGLSLVAEPQSTTALVGCSGSGKSTIFNLLLRLYDNPHGSITIDGQNILAVSRNSVRASIAYLGQDTFLFHGTIAENIEIGRLGASEKEIVAAAAAANAHEFISMFPNGYRTHVGEHGLALSSGQRQRIAIARAFLKNAPIILLDEPTASLDTISEREVQRAIELLCQGRTTLVIAHRMHTVINAATIHVIEGGRVAESGDHATLLREGLLYRAFQEPTDDATKFRKEGATIATDYDHFISMNGSQ
jgi:ABC-type multidrug transport system fused ATPase/permease subunit